VGLAEKEWFALTFLRSSSSQQDPTRVVFVAVKAWEAGIDIFAFVDDVMLGLRIDLDLRSFCGA